MMFYNNFKLGVLGGGQLGRMLLQPCSQFNVMTRMIDPDPDAPCAKMAQEFVNRSIQDYDTVYEFGKKCDLITIEVENVNTRALKKLEEEGIPVYPQPRVIDIIKDKRLQKQFYRDHHIPTAEFVLVEDKEDITRHADFLPAFQKIGVGGYDGGGVQRLNSSDDLKKVLEGPGLLEKLVNIKKELSVIVARTPSGEVTSFPAVELVYHPEHNLVDYLMSPADISTATEEAARQLAEKVITDLDMVGILAVELFLTPEDQLMVNECAPRPHNSGHQTINANHVSQYEQHLRSILDLPLGDTSLKCPSAMVNLLGEDGYKGEAIYDGIESLLKINGVNLYLYGKRYTRPFRKMGHITITSADKSELAGRVEEVKQKIRVIA